MTVRVGAIALAAGHVAVGSSQDSAFAQDAWGSLPSFALKLNPDARFITWDSKADTTGQTVSSGMQYYVPFGGKFTVKNEALRFDVLARSGYVWTKNTVTASDGSKRVGEVETQTDTSVSGTVTVYTIPGIQPYVSFAANIPTGTTVLNRNERLALVDSDIVQVPSFGQGQNLATTIGANIPISQIAMISVSWGYNDRGEFDRLRPIFITDVPSTFDPGDTSTIDVGYSFELGALSFWINASHIRETASTLDDSEFDNQAYFQSGKGTIFSGGFSYTWDANWSSEVNVSRMDYSRNRVFDEAAFTLLEEPFNSNNKLTTVSVQTTYTNGRLSLTPLFTYTHRKNNDYDPVTFEFVPSKNIFTTGISGKYTLSDNASISARVERSWLYEFENPEKTGVIGSGTPQINSDVWLYTLGGSVNF